MLIEDIGEGKYIYNFVWNLYLELLRVLEDIWDLLFYLLLFFCFVGICVLD